MQVQGHIDQLEATSTSSPTTVQDQEQCRAPPPLLPQAVHDADREGSDGWIARQRSSSRSGTDGLDKHPDKQKNARLSEMDGRQLMSVGKHKGESSSSLYEGDTGYVAWACCQGQGKSSGMEGMSEGLRRFKVYILARDVAKTNRVAKQMIEMDREKQTKRDGGSQWSRISENPGTTHSTARRQQMEEGTGDWMRVDKVEAIDARQKMVLKKMERQEEKKRIIRHRCQRDLEKTNLIVSAAL